MIDTTKPHLTIDEIAVKRGRCGEAKTAGLPCLEFPAPAPLVFSRPCARYDSTTRGCTMHGRCREADRVERGQARDLKGCRDFYAVGDVDKTLKPERVIRVNLPTHYNCGIIEWQGKTIMASRLGWTGSRIVLSELGEDYQPTTSWELNTRHPRTLHGSEDPRLLVFQDRLHVAFTGYYAMRTGTVQLYARLDPTLRKVENIFMPSYDKAGPMEKNWQFFVHDGKLLSVYTISPHVILQHQGNQVCEVARTESRIRWTNLRLRGGAPPVRVGDEYYHWFHTVRHDRGKYEYGIALYTFEARLPFAIKRFIPSVVMVADGLMPGGGKSVVFPCGAILRGGKWVVSFGWHDQECRIAFFDAAEIERRLA